MTLPRLHAAVTDLLGRLCSSVVAAGAVWWHVEHLAAALPTDERQPVFGAPVPAVAGPAAARTAPLSTAVRYAAAAPLTAAEAAAFADLVARLYRS